MVDRAGVTTSAIARSRHRPFAQSFDRAAMWFAQSFDRAAIARSCDRAHPKFCAIARLLCLPESASDRLIAQQCDLHNREIVWFFDLSDRPIGHGAICAIIRSCSNCTIVRSCTPKVLHDRSIIVLARVSQQSADRAAMRFAQS